METQAARQQLAADPGFLLSRVGAAVRAGFKEVLAGWRIRPLQYVILLALDTGGGASQQELCAVAGIDSGNMVELLDGLEALGYARRARDPRDRRRYVVTMTRHGQSALGELRRAIEEYNMGFLSPLTEPERQRLTSILGKLYATTAEGQPRTPRWEPPDRLSANVLTSWGHGPRKSKRCVRVRARRGYAVTNSYRWRTRAPSRRSPRPRPSS